MSEGRFDLSTFRSERTNEASTLTITPKRSSSRDVGYDIPEEAVPKNMYLEFAYKLRPLKGYGLKVSYTRNYPFSKKGLERALKKRRWV
ncbi:hypothetical protein TNCV_1320701 [Trichonephila clavipes]|nr:hypothetical protein TNCV_1320701 [Trichonephila clavipes]